MTDKTPLDLDAIEKRANAATDGPWHPDAWEKFIRMAIAEDAKDNLDAAILLCLERDSESITRRDAEFIAHARTDVPALIAEVRRLRIAGEQQQDEIIKLAEIGQSAEELAANYKADNARMREALTKARVCVATWSPNPDEPLAEIDAVLSTDAKGEEVPIIFTFTQAEMDMRRNSDRAYVEAIVKDAYEDAAKIADTYGEQVKSGHWLSAAKEIAARIRSLITTPVDEGSGCVFCDCGLEAKDGFHEPNSHTLIGCTNRARTTGAKSP